MFVLYRILGNDLPPRHEKGCALDCTKLIVENEKLPANVHRRWLLNRIFDEDMMEQILDYLEDSNCPYSVIPFSPGQYAALKTKQEKIDYITNVNHARNCAIREGLKYGNVVLPLDSRSVFSPNGIETFINTVSLNPNRAVYLIGQWRLPDRNLGEDGPLYQDTPELSETYFHLSGSRRVAYREPAVAFTENADVLFDESLPYGEGDKCQLLMQYGVQGIWDHWFPAPTRMSKYAGNQVHAGWVGILPTKNKTADMNNLERGKFRAIAIANAVEAADKQVKMLGYVVDGRE